MIGESVWNAILPGRNPVLQKLVVLIAIKNSVCVFRPHVQVLHACVPASESTCNKSFSHHQKSCAFSCFIGCDVNFRIHKVTFIVVVLFIHLRASVVAPVVANPIEFFCSTKSIESVLFPQIDMVYCFNHSNMTSLFLQIQFASVTSRRSICNTSGFAMVVSKSFCL